MSATLECIGGPMDGRRFCTLGSESPFTVEVHSHTESDKPRTEVPVCPWGELLEWGEYDPSTKLGTYRADFRMWCLVWEPSC